MKRAIMFISLLLVLCSSAAAQTGHMKLLAAVEDSDRGSVADLYLEIKPGQGRVYIDTFPLTKLDTQISTRFAKQLACDHLDMDCSKYDFFYTIRSDSVIIGGPSAGAATAMLTMAVLEGWKLDNETAVTGTINSGGFIGSVGGIDQKLDAARQSGIRKVLIPKGDMIKTITTTGNGSMVLTEETVDHRETAEKLNITLIEVATIDEVIEEFTGIAADMTNYTLVPDPEYTRTMRSINDMLCSRAQDLRVIVIDKDSSLYQSAENLTRLGRQATEEQSYYSSASFCFRASIAYREASMLEQNLTPDDIRKMMREVRDEIAATDEEVEANGRKTLTDLQAYIIVHDRLVEAEDYLRDTADDLNKNLTASSVHDLSYAIERHYSAIAWSTFFGKGSSEILLDNESLENTCIQKISEAEERYQFASLYVPTLLKDTRKGIDQGYDDMRQGRYELCIFKASRAKAEADAILNMMGMTQESFDQFFDIRLKLIEREIAQEQAEGHFPILGFSYYEYAKNLRYMDIYSAQVFSEYALELSNLGMYFKDDRKRSILSMIDYRPMMIFLLGVILGVLLTILFVRANKKMDDMVQIRIRKTLANTRSRGCLRGKKR